VDLPVDAPDMQGLFLAFCHQGGVTDDVGEPSSAPIIIGATADMPACPAGRPACPAGRHNGCELTFLGYFFHIRLISGIYISQINAQYTKIE
jgi:hypothetical protein